jgi:hypothetical protein
VPLRAVLYKLARLHALLWALPAGVWAAHAIESARRIRWVPAVLALACVPTTLVVPWAYLAWASRAGEQPLRGGGARLSTRPESGPELFAAEKIADPAAVVVLPFAWPGAAVDEGLVQGNPLTAVLHHSLFADLPQTHNERLPDLEARLDLLDAAYSDPAPAAAVERIRRTLPGRATLWFLDGSSEALERALGSAGARELARTSGGLSLSSLPASAP